MIRPVSRPWAFAIALAFLFDAGLAAAQSVTPEDSAFRLSDPGMQHPAAPTSAWIWATGDYRQHSALWERGALGFELGVTHVSVRGDHGYPTTFTHSDEALDALVFLVERQKRPIFEDLASVEGTVGTMRVVSFNGLDGEKCIGFVVFYHRYFDMNRKGLGGSVCALGNPFEMDRETMIEALKGLSMDGEFEHLIE